MSRRATDAWLDRRRFLAGAAMQAGFQAAARPASAGEAIAAKAPRRRMLSASFYSSEMDVVTVPQTTTYIVTLTLEAPAERFRIGVANSTPAAFELGGACCAVVGSAAWTRLAFGDAGGGPGRPARVPGNHVAAIESPKVPAILWSDWAHVPDQPTGRPTLELRLLVRPQTLPLTLTARGNPLHALLPQVADRPFSTLAIAGDYVTRAQPMQARGEPSVHAPVIGVQYEVATPGVQLVIGGDSQLSTWDTFARLTAAALSNPGRPIAVWNAAWAGQGSGTFLPIMEAAVAATHASIVLLEGWTANDGMNQAAYTRYLASLGRSVAFTEQQGAIPIVLAPMPRALFGTPELSGWLALRANLRSQLPPVTVFDVVPIVGDSGRAGNWRPEFSTANGIHISPAGNAALVGAFQRILAPLL